mgnify:CR=1 FL=1
MTFGPSWSGGSRPLRAAEDHQTIFIDNITVFDHSVQHVLRLVPPPRLTVWQYDAVRGAEPVLHQRVNLGEEDNR